MNKEIDTERLSFEEFEELPDKEILKCDKGKLECYA